jgi:histidine triad (HIT) family protein
MSECIFCRIAAGELGTQFVYENESVVAFDDVSPQAPVHTLIVPRAHYENLGDSVEAEVLSALLAAVPEVASRKGVAESGYRTIINSGADAGQTVHHLHVHVLGGARMAEGMMPRCED